MVSMVVVGSEASFQQGLTAEREPVPMSEGGRPWHLHLVREGTCNAEPLLGSVKELVARLFKLRSAFQPAKLE